MAINLSLVKGLWDRLGARTKLIGVAVVAFFLGMFWGGHRPTGGEYGRYVAIGADGHLLLDTRTGDIWVLDPDTHKFKRQASIPYF